MLKSLGLVIGGAVFATVLILACSDDTPDVDAGGPVCDCDPAEPPLAGRITQENETSEDVSGASVSAGVSCEEGSILLGGGCEVTGANADDLVLFQAGQSPNGRQWNCEWSNPIPVTTSVRAWAVCLEPAEAK